MKVSEIIQETTISGGIATVAMPVFTGKKGKAHHKAAKKAVRKTKRAAAPRKTARLWLMFPQRLITKPVVWELSQKFPVVTNVRQASVTGEIGLVCLELDGLANDVKKAVAWLERRGVSVEPVEINVIES